MDNSLPDGGQPQDQNTQAPQSNYQQYLDPVSKPPNKRRKLMIFGGLGFILVIILISVAIAMGHKGQSPTTQTEQTASCTDSSCFEENFKNCTKTVPYAYEASGSKIYYTITGKEDAGCTLDVEYVSGALGSDAQGKKMTCEFDNSIDFSTSYQNVFRFPDDYDCSGDLANIIKSLNPDQSG